MRYPHTMELKDALAQQQAKEARVRQLREGVAAELARIDSELDEITADVTVLSRLVARYEGGAVTSSAQVTVQIPMTDSQSDAVWQSLPRMNAVERVLHEASGPVSPARVGDVLLEHGRDDTSKNIHAALGHLKLKGRATQSGRGLWIPLNRANGQSTEVTSATL
jgi:hypothetical protein